MPIRHHVPERTCFACRQAKPKGKLTRLVRTRHGEIEIDHSGKKPGRGAYLCQTRECWDLALHKQGKNRLARALRIEIRPVDESILIEHGKTLPSIAVAAAERGNV